MALENVLAGIPGLGGYLATQQMNEQRAAQGLQQLLGVAKFVEDQRANALREQITRAQLEEYKAKQGEREQRSAALKDFIGQAGSIFPPQAIPAGTGVTGGMDEGATGKILGPQEFRQDPRAALLPAIARLDPGGLSDVFRTMFGASNRNAGVDPMIVRMHQAADQAEAAGKPELAQQLRTNAARLANGYSDVQLGRYQGNDFANQLEYRKARDSGIPDLPAPGSARLPGSAPQAAPQPAPQVAPQPAPPGGLPNVPPDVQARRDDRRLQLLQDERAREVAAGNAANVANIDREIELISGRGGANAPMGKPRTEERFIEGVGNRVVNVRRVGGEERVFFEGRDVTAIARPKQTTEDVKQQRQNTQDIATRNDVMSKLGQLEDLVRLQGGDVAGPWHWTGGAMAGIGNVFGGKLQSPASQASQLVDSILTGMEKLNAISNKEGDIYRKNFGVGEYLQGSPTKVQAAINLMRSKLEARYSGAEVPSGRTQFGASGGSEDEALLNRYRR